MHPLSFNLHLIVLIIEVYAIATVRACVRVQYLCDRTTVVIRVSRSCCKSSPWISVLLLHCMWYVILTQERRHTIPLTCDILVDRNVVIVAAAGDLVCVLPLLKFYPYLPHLRQLILSSCRWYYLRIVFNTGQNSYFVIQLRNCHNLS